MSPIKESPEEPWPDLLVDRRPLQQKRVWKSRDPVEVERNNLVAIRCDSSTIVAYSSGLRIRDVDPISEFFHPGFWIPDPG